MFSRKQFGLFWKLLFYSFYCTVIRVFTVEKSIIELKYPRYYFRKKIYLQKRSYRLFFYER